MQRVQPQRRPWTSPATCVCGAACFEVRMALCPVVEKSYQVTTSTLFTGNLVTTKSSSLTKHECLCSRSRHNEQRVEKFVLKKHFNRLGSRTVCCAQPGWSLQCRKRELGDGVSLSHQTHRHKPRFLRAGDGGNENLITFDLRRREVRLIPVPSTECRNPRVNATGRNPEYPKPETGQYQDL